MINLKKYISKQYTLFRCICREANAKEVNAREVNAREAATRYNKSNKIIKKYSPAKYILVYLIQI